MNPQLNSQINAQDHSASALVTAQRSRRRRVVGGALAAALLGAATIGAVSATAAPSDASASPAPAQPVTVGKDLTRSTSHLTLAAATKAAQATLDAAKKAGRNVSVAVVDRDGNTLVQLRGDGAGPQSYESAARKAYTAVSWGTPTSELVGRLSDAPTLKDIPGTLFLAGGVPVRAEGAPVAGIGVGGAPSGAQDEQFAQAGADALSE
ncbi:heme-binding protein [Streptomyces sp. NPDC058773]|uniref:GlcG/HbpS family heme-binding protein n=1 Tax=Streptomyces sp. NPDC058773 TaxID=3346632 RepID=UPI0036B2E7A8